VVSLHLCFLVSFRCYAGSPSSASSSRLRSGVSDVAGHSLALVFVRISGDWRGAAGASVRPPPSLFFFSVTLVSFLFFTHTERVLQSRRTLTNTTLFSLSFSGLFRSAHNLVLLRCVPERRVATTPFFSFSFPLPLLVLSSSSLSPLFSRGLGATGDGPTLSSVKLVL
jgi:hypothetical protein